MSSIKSDFDDVYKMKEFDVVEILHTIVLADMKLEAGAQGAIVHEWSNGLLEVEFPAPIHLVAISRYSVKLVYSHEFHNNTPEVGEG